MRISIRNNSSYIIEFDQLIVSGREAAGGYAFSFTLRGSRRACNAPVSISVRPSKLPGFIVLLSLLY